MKEKSGVKLADSIREMINTKISEKPVKSRIFEDFEGIKNAPPRLLLSERSGVRIPFGTPKTPPENPAKSRVSGVFLFFANCNSKLKQFFKYHN